MSPRKSNRCAWEDGDGDGSAAVAAERVASEAKNGAKWQSIRAGTATGSTLLHGSDQIDVGLFVRIHPIENPIVIGIDTPIVTA